jgi:hypothetical protein
VLHPTSSKQATGAWRITSKNLGRDLEVDLSYHPDGISDYGEEHGLTPIDAVQRYGGATDAVTAAMWLCQKLRIEPAHLGWQGRGNGKDYEASNTNGHANESAHSKYAAPHASEETDVSPWPILNSRATYGLVGEIANLCHAQQRGGSERCHGHCVGMGGCKLRA